MNTLKLLIRNVSNKLLPPSILDGIIAQGFEPVNGTETRDFPKDWELYGRDKERIIYDGRTDEVVNRYSL